MSEEHGTDHSEISTENGAIHQQEKVRKSTVLTTSGTVPANICASFMQFYVIFKTTEYDRVNTRFNVAAHSTAHLICRFQLIDVKRYMPWDNKYCHGHEHIP